MAAKRLDGLKQNSDAALAAQGSYQGIASAMP
jgi:hypothetical protein